MVSSPSSIIIIMIMIIHSIMLMMNISSGVHVINMSGYCTTIMVITCDQLWQDHIIILINVVTILVHHHHHNVMFMNFSPPLNLCTLFTKGFWKYKPNEEFGDGAALFQHLCLYIKPNKAK